jgi:hypothetical protein
MPWVLPPDFLGVSAHGFAQTLIINGKFQYIIIQSKFHSQTEAFKISEQ